MIKVKKYKRVIAFVLLIAVMWSMLLSWAVQADYVADVATGYYQAANRDTLNCKSYAIVEISTGTIVETKNPDVHIEVGNITKLMTMYLALEHMVNAGDNLQTMIPVSVNAQLAARGRATVYLDGYKREKISIEQALTAVSIASAVDAAYVLAEYVSGTESNFVAHMNAKAKEMGMNDSYFADCSGVSVDGQYTTAHDLAVLSYNLLSKHPEITNYTKLTYGKFEHKTTDGSYTEMVSANNLTRHKFFPQSDGLLIGSSKEDGYSMVGTVQKDGSRVATVVLGCLDQNYRAAETRFLLEYGVENFEYRNIEVSGTFVRKVNVKKGEETRIKTETLGEFSTILNVNDFDRIQRKVVINKELVVPVAKGTEVGEIIYSLDGEELGRVTIITSEDMEKAGWFKLLVRAILEFFGFV